MLCACLTSTQANEKMLGPRSVGVGVFLGRSIGRLAWYIMQNVCPNVVYGVFCTYLFVEIWCLLGSCPVCLSKQAPPKNLTSKQPSKQPPNT